MIVTCSPLKQGYWLATGFLVLLCFLLFIKTSMHCLTASVSLGYDLGRYFMARKVTRKMSCHIAYLKNRSCNCKISGSLWCCQCCCSFVCSMYISTKLMLYLKSPWCSEDVWHDSVSWGGSSPSSWSHFFSVLRPSHAHSPSLSLPFPLPAPSGSWWELWVWGGMLYLPLRGLPICVLQPVP